MIVKPHDKMKEIWWLEALYRRLLREHPSKKTVELDLIKKKREVRGEREVDYPLSFLPKNDYFILHNLRIRDENGYFQIDTLILSASFMLILEVKNWYGTLIFGEKGQVIRIGDNQEEEGFSSPIPQAKTQQYRLQRWLQKHGYTKVLLPFFVVISFPSTIIKVASPDKHIPEEVVHNNELFFEIQELGQNHPARTYKMNQLKNLASLLIKANVPKPAKTLDKYGVSKNDDLIKGVICPFCSAYPLHKERLNWFCKKCGKSSENEHLTALKDYKLLIGETISNHDAREFLQVQSSHKVKRLLQKAGFPCTGNNRWRVYKL
ncbi:nuclease-related domain-containing protein [Lentibacillus sediminis]|uniref:nuclease-related domain-containing protein n=1 Tax=Lentibacillus sediminis TaxID=1940529 RepID=UPI000C1B89FC|nr:nuclease-related domain-containing protein [Lentibacillus sediminis]